MPDATPAMRRDAIAVLLGLPVRSPGLQHLHRAGLLQSSDWAEPVLSTTGLLLVYRALADGPLDCRVRAAAEAEARRLGGVLVTQLQLRMETHDA